MRWPFSTSMNTPNSGDPFEPFDIHVERFVEMITEHITKTYGPPDQTWLEQAEKANAGREENERPTWGFDEYKAAVFRPSLKGIGMRGFGKKKSDFPETRQFAFNESKRLMSWYGIERSDLLSSEPAQFATDKFTSWPYYAAALALVVERARRTPHDSQRALPDRSRKTKQRRVRTSNEEREDQIRTPGGVRGEVRSGPKRTGSGSSVQKPDVP